MKILRFFGCSFAAVFLSIDAQADAALDPELKGRLLATGLDLITITTKKGEEPGYDWVWAPEGCFGAGPVNATKVGAQMIVEHGAQTIYDSGAYKKNVSGLTIKVRGNASAGLAKKSFKIKLQVSADLLQRGDSRFEDREWNLLASATSLNFFVGTKVNELFCLQWTPRGRHVNLVINGDYRGLYLLTESVKRSPGSRVDVDEDGFIFEYDAYWWKEDVFFKTPETPTYAGFTFKYPDADDITENQVLLISNAVAAVERSLDDGTYPDVLDVDSAVSWLLARDILGFFDGAGANVFLTKGDSTAAKVTMGNLWDFDSIRMQEGQWDVVHDLFWFPGLFASPNPLFRENLVERWCSVKDSIGSEISRSLLELLSSDEGRGIARSRSLDGERWGVSHPTVIEDVLENLRWFTNRIGWINEHVQELSSSGGVNPGGFRKFWTMPGQAFRPMRAVSGNSAYMGSLLDANGTVLGVVSLKVGKANLKRNTSAVSGSLTTLDGKRHAIAKVLVPIGDAPQTVTGVDVKGYGRLSLTIGGDGFFGLIATDHGLVGIGTDSVFTGLASALAVFSCDSVETFDGLAVLTECLPLAEPVKTMPSGQWKTAPPASVRFGRDRQTGSMVLQGTDDPERTNVSGLKLRYDSRAASFAGSFKLRLRAGAPERPRIKNVTVKVTGVTVRGMGFGVAKVKQDVVSDVRIN